MHFVYSIFYRQIQNLEKSEGFNLQEETEFWFKVTDTEVVISAIL